jgi:hypothetical protein
MISLVDLLRRSILLIFILTNWMRWRAIYSHKHVCKGKYFQLNAAILPPFISCWQNAWRMRSLSLSHGFPLFHVLCQACRFMVKMAGEFNTRGGSRIYGTLWKGTHGGGAAPDSERRRHLKIQVLICVFLASGNKIPRLSYFVKKHFFSGENFWFCAINERLLRCF